MYTRYNCRTLFTKVAAATLTHYRDHDPEIFSSTPCCPPPFYLCLGRLNELLSFCRAICDFPRPLSGCMCPTSRPRSGCAFVLSLRNDRLVITPAQRHEREVAESRRRVQTSLLLLAASATAHLGHHAHCLLPPGTVDHAPFLDSLLPKGWFEWFQAGVATAALVGPGGGELICYFPVHLDKGEVTGYRLTGLLLSSLRCHSCDSLWFVLFQGNV